MKSNGRMSTLAAVALALTFNAFLVGCNKGSEASGGPAASAASTSAPAAAAACDVAAFEKEQDEKGREAHVPKKFTGCKLDAYDPKSKTATFAGNGKMKLRCTNVPQPEGVAVGDLADVDGKVDTGGFVTLYGCNIVKSK